VRRPIRGASNGALRCVLSTIQKSVEELDSKDELVNEMKDADEVQLMKKENSIILLFP